MRTGKVIVKKDRYTGTGRGRGVMIVEEANSTFSSLLYSNLEKERKRKEELGRQKEERRKNKLGVR